MSDPDDVPEDAVGLVELLLSTDADAVEEDDRRAAIVGGEVWVSDRLDDYSKEDLGDSFEVFEYKLRWFDTVESVREQLDLRDTTDD